jgi:hypothetical protein
MWFCGRPLFLIIKKNLLLTLVYCLCLFVRVEYGMGWDGPRYIWPWNWNGIPLLVLFKTANVYIENISCLKITSAPWEDR